jgi:hypothetical protein
MEYLRSFTNVFGLFNSNNEEKIEKTEKTEKTEIETKVIDKKLSKMNNFDEKNINIIKDNLFYKNINKIQDKIKNNQEIKNNKRELLIEKQKTKITYIRKNDLDEQDYEGD